ncbi:hypothetical protein AQUSIP_20280 [Aquicella siphonis]|uniref:Colicin V production protein n=1 Tax=Aquicella siphonis TaxID=254247 RepID=A0A5E4PJW5_9COXI|nr:CvpA family protein [Aquicella siphonis]VVC76703.1 hypothetical protein AQUSIP_20280 [Aquicella siphonis]
MSGWNGLDFLIFIILVVNTVLGMVRGGSREAISLMCLSAALIVTIRFTVPLANLINSSPLIEGVVNNTFMQNFMQAIDAGPLTVDLLNQLGYTISMLVCFVGTFSACEAGLSMTGFLEAYGFATAVINRKLGGALGLTRGYIINLLFLSILAIHLNPGFDSRLVSGSYFAGLFSSQTLFLDKLISSQDVEKYHELYMKQNIKPEQLYKVLSKPEDITEPAPAGQNGSAINPSTQTFPGGQFGPGPGSPSGVAPSSP